MRLFSMTLTFAVSLVFMACTGPVRGKDDASGASFYVNSVKGGGSPNMQKGSVWAIPESVSYTFKACLSSRASHKDLYSQEFQVEIPGSPQIIPVKTNRAEACFDWQETIPFNHFAGQSGWVEITRDIVGRGVATGKQRVRIAINPWVVSGRDHGDAVVFLEAGSPDLIPPKVYEAKDGVRALSGELQGAASLLVQNVSIKAIPEGEDKTWVSLLVEVIMNPVVKSFNANGEPVYQPVQDGDFDMMMQVLASGVGADMNKKVILLGGDLRAVGKAVNGQLKAEFKVRQERRASQGNLELVMQIKPSGLNAYKTLLPFNGLFRFGPGSVVSEQSGTLANTCLEQAQNCDYQSILQQTANYSDLIKHGYIQENSRYIFSTLKLRFTSILPGETATQRIVVYTASTCITDNQTGRPLANAMMKIRYTKVKGGRIDVEPDFIDKATDESGCLSWNGQAFHKYYEPEEFFEKEVTVERAKEMLNANGDVIMDPASCRPKIADGRQTPGPDGKPAIDPITCKPIYVAANGFSRVLKFYLNPWDDKFTFGWDAREFTDEFFREIRSRKKIRSRFFLSDYQYHTVRFLYNIDQYMDLEVKKWVLISLVPQVLRYSGIVNARKMVEHVRDGIYLMKIAIQKSYLDPRDNSGWLLHNSPEYQAQLESLNGRELATKEFITTNMSLVRVVDGVIIFPLDLTMRDLRLMRVRSNFVIQLETVDERLIQAYHIFKKYATTDEDLARKLEDFKSKVKDGTTLEDVKAELGRDDMPDYLRAITDERSKILISKDVAAARTDLEARVKRIQDLVQISVARLSMSFEAGGRIGDPVKGGLVNVPHGALINDTFEVRPDLFNDLKSAMNFDFSEIKLPNSQDIDLNNFIERNSGLSKRSFVGPVIFLSNAYSDSVRATDNLDEANCVDPDPAKNQDVVRDTMEELELTYAGDEEAAKKESALFNNRQNNAYQFNKYFNSLSHLCYKNVDDLIEDEKKLKAHWHDQSVAASLKYNFVDNFHLDFVSLTDEPLLRENPDCKGAAADCLVKADDHALPVSSLEPLINADLDHALHILNTNWDHAFEQWHGIDRRAGKTQWKPSEFLRLFYERTPDSRAGLCNLVAHRIALELRNKQLSTLNESVIAEKVNEACGSDKGLVHDIKLHVERTGNYLFLGGLNLNLNVGEGFSVSASSGWGAGFDVTDAIGAAGGLMGAGAAMSVLKPFSLKYGTSLSSSEGTSVSESTYLVSQIARFELDINAYERCAAVRLSDSGIDQMRRSWGDSGLSRFFGLSTANFSDPAVINVFRHGLFVCEGQNRLANKPRKVKESYFYFTQHFTEGDMLDQADLYNHPWLLGMRGMRDFTVFVDKIRAQELTGFGEFLSSATGSRAPLRKGWALEHLRDAYRNILPSFPGFYTILDQGEQDIDAFALEQTESRFSKTDMDPLREVNHPELKK